MPGFSLLNKTAKVTIVVHYGSLIWISLKVISFCICHGKRSGVTVE